MTRFLVILLALLASGCSVLLADPEEEIPLDSAPAADAPAPSPDASADAEPDPEPACDMFADTGCEGSDVCKRNEDQAAECVPSLGDKTEGEACATSWECAAGLGCNGTCMAYCDEENPCGSGECLQGFCQ